ncbi:MAG TPA: helix-turn-helix domain-containing protein [Gaiellaceae bacterium]|nr:helix-turn-helix domain-containing protein [Gaiellaceae bacterium]
MSVSRAYRPGRSGREPTKTRARIVGAVRELLGEGTFHESTVEDVAKRAGVARATLYQHFGSRLGLVDALCETLDENPALISIREAVADDDPETALDRTVAGGVRFWASEEAVLQPLYGVAAVDQSAGALVDRQTADRRSELERLVRNLRQQERLAHGLTDRRALALLLVLTSFETFQELRRRAGLSEREVAATLRASARALLLA